MITDQCTKIFDVSVVSFWYMHCMFYLVFITKTLITTQFFFLILRMPIILIGNCMSLKASSLAKSLSGLVIPFGLWFTGCKNLTKHHLKYPLLSIF